MVTGPDLGFLVLQVIEAIDRLLDQSVEDVVCELQPYLSHEPLVGLVPLLLLLVVLAVEYLLIYYFFDDLLSLLVLEDLADLVLLRGGLRV